MTLICFAALCMLVQDVLGVLLVDAETRGHGWLAGLVDALMWGFGIATTTITVTALQGHDLRDKVAVIAAVSLANVLGSRIGVELGQRFVK